MSDAPREDADADVVERAAEAIRKGGLVVYPTDTVYGLGADALAPDAIERVFETKGRSRDRPLSLGVPDVEAALAYATPTEREERFMRAFLPGPVTVVVERRESVPDALTAGSDRVGVRIPDHEVALELLDEFAPITATSANRSGEENATHPDQLDPDIREGVGAVVDAGELPGGESTVVDPEGEVVHRRGPQADAIEEWLAEN